MANSSAITGTFRQFTSLCSQTASPLESMNHQIQNVGQIYRPMEDKVSYSMSIRVPAWRSGSVFINMCHPDRWGRRPQKELGRLW